MDIKKIRVLVGTISGLVAAALSLIWLLFIDITMKVSASWLIAALGLGLIPGIFLTMGSYFATEDEKIKSTIFLFLAFLLFVAFIIVLSVMPNNAAIITSAKKAPSFATIRMIVFICFILISIISLAAAIFDLIAKIKVRKEKDSLPVTQ